MSLSLKSKNETIEKAYTEYINTKTRTITEEIESQKPKKKKSHHIKSIAKWYISTSIIKSYKYQYKIL